MFGLVQSFMALTSNVNLIRNQVISKLQLPFETQEAGRTQISAEANPQSLAIFSQETLLDKYESLMNLGEDGSYKAYLSPSSQACCKQ